MAKRSKRSDIALSDLTHEALNDAAIVLGVAHLCLLTKEMPSDLRAELLRIMDTSRSLADKLKLMAEVLQEEA